MFLKNISTSLHLLSELKSTGIPRIIGVITYKSVTFKGRNIYRKLKKECLVTESSSNRKEFELWMNQKKCDANMQNEERYSISLFGTLKGEQHPQVPYMMDMWKILSLASHRCKKCGKYEDREEIGSDHQWGIHSYIWHIRGSFYFHHMNLLGDVELIQFFGLFWSVLLRSTAMLLYEH